MKYWDMDKVQTETLTRLRSDGYEDIKPRHMVMFKLIYDFVCRFADRNYASPKTVVEMTTGPVPPKTQEIITKIGYDKLFLHFSPLMYPKKFYPFCKKLVDSGRVDPKDYVSSGLITTREIDVVSTEYVPA